MRHVRDVIAQLDIQRAQVLVEGIVAEVSANKQKNVGVNRTVFNPNTIAAAGILSDSVTTALTSYATSGSPTAALGALGQDRKSTRLNSSHKCATRMPSSS